MDDPSPCFDPKELRKVLGAYVTGVTVITSVDASGRPVGLTANSFSSVSLEPPLVLWSQSLSAPSYPVFRDAKRFAVSILAEDQIDVSNRFSKGGAEKFADVKTRQGLGGIPLIEGAAAYLECTREASYPGGDHAVFLGRIERIEQHWRNPLVFGGGKYLIAAPHDLGPFSIDLGASSLGHVRAVRMAAGHARALAAELALTVGVGVWGNHGPTMVHWEESTHPVSVNLRTGLVLPVLDSATGLALAAHLPRALSQSHISLELEAQRGQSSLRGWNDVECALAAVQQQGVARTLTDEAFTAMYGSQVNAVSAPVFGPDGMVALALTVLGRACEAPPDWHERVSVPLKRTADALSATLGAPPARPDRQA